VVLASLNLAAIILGIPSVILDFEERFRLNAAAAIAYHVAYVILILAVLFRRDARGWFARQRFASGT
jgi:hypothetical protein